jgi:enoyl-CoA hydratase/carnithine racemase
MAAHTYTFELLSVDVDRGVAFATIDNPPINLMTIPLYFELARFSEEVEADDEVRVVVLQSANPDFFIAHFDVAAILQFPIDAPAERETEHNAFHAMCERFRTMPKATIGKIAGRVGGGGSELSASLDMRFGAVGKTFVNQMEVALGILPGGTGTQRLPRLVGRGRALEIILGSDDLDAETADKWGYLNRALPPDELGPFVDKLAYRIASFPATAVALAKAAVLNAESPWRDGLIEEGYLFQQSVRTQGAQRNMKKFLEIGGQTRDGELRVGELCAELGEI